uniref:ATP synthase peripheral stalk subunit F6, mitochondrial n=1 Tax=Equus asinus asinus TaxID=83772 RepID=A0A8C4LWX6_EQUAS
NKTIQECRRLAYGDKQNEGKKSPPSPVDVGPEYQQDLERELFKLKQMYGKVDMNTFPNFKFEDLSNLNKTAEKPKTERES